jgi:hypothetical protein
MPSWKKIITSGSSDASLAALFVSNAVTSSIFSGSRFIGASFTGSFTGSLTGRLIGTASFASTASFINSGTTNAFVQGGNSFGAAALIGTNDNQNFAIETNGSTKVTVDTSGNVGIGTTAPGQKLDVIGRLRFRSDTSTTPGFWLTDNAGTEDVFVGLQSTTSTSAFGVYSAGSWRFTILNGGNVGIGVTSPAYKLQVVGNLAVGSNTAYTDIVLENSASIGGYNQTQVLYPRTFPGSGVAQHLTYFKNSGSPGAQTVHSVSIDGNVGIGTTTPGANLQIGYQNSSTSEMLRLGVSYTGSPTQRGVITWHDSTDVTGQIDTRYDGAKVNMHFGSLFNSGYNSTVRMTILGDGNVGIGTTTPGSKLEVNGSTSISGQTIVTSDSTEQIVIKTASDTNRQLLLGYNYSGNYGAIQAIQQGTAYTPLTLNALGGNVGIGTTTPTVGKLQINTGAASNNAVTIQAISQTSITYGIGIDASSNLAIYDNFSSAQRVTINGSGNVGIGTVTPTERLHVVGGNIKVNNGDAVYFGDSSNNNGGRIYVPAASNEFYINQANNASLVLLTNNTTRVTISGGGNVGIGITTPNALLDVAGGINSRNTRVDATRKYPIGHHSSGDTVFEIDPTWTQAQLQDYFGSTAFTWNTDSTAPGGYVIQVDAAVNVGNGAYSSGFPYVPVDTGSNDWYYMECWIRNEAGSEITHYMGGIDYNASFGVLGGNPGSYTYNVMLNYNPGTTWTKVFGYWNGTGTASGGNGTGNTNNWVNGTKYFGPQALFNYNTISGTSRCYISGWRLIKASNSGNKVFNNGITVAGGTLGSTSGDRKILQEFTTRTDNVDNLEITNIRIGNGSDWFTAGHRIQQKVDGYWMGYIQFNGGNNSGISIGTGLSNSLPTSVSERLRITSGGNIGLGTTTPQKPLEAISDSNDFVSVGVNQIADEAWTGIHFGYREANNLYRKSAIVFQRTDLTENNAQGKVHILNGPQSGAGNATLSDARLTIAENGSVGILTTSPAYALDVLGTIRATGDVIAYSDARVKDNIQPIENALEKVISLRGVSYNRKDTDDKSRKIGVIAQEVLPIIPEVVSKDQNGNYSVSYGNMVGLLIEAVKEQQKQIDELKYLLENKKKKK